MVINNCGSRVGYLLRLHCLKVSKNAEKCFFTTKRFSSAPVNVVSERKVKDVTNSEISEMRNVIFEKEKKRQRNLVKRLEKISVSYEGLPESVKLVMNKDLSTPHDCARHIREYETERSVLALVNGELWDMHRPLVEDCTLKFLHFRENNPIHCNKAFWRTCSFMLGYTFERAFKKNHLVTLCSFPPANVTSGSFVYDLSLSFDNWKPTEMELATLSRPVIQLTSQNLPFEPLVVDGSVAQEAFKHNKFKYNQIPRIAAQSHSGSSVTLYRVGAHVDMTSGPLISHTGQLGYRFSIVALHDIDAGEYGNLIRVQGVAIPSDLRLHSWTFDVLRNRACKLNLSPVMTSEGQVPVRNI